MRHIHLTILVSYSIEMWVILTGGILDVQTNKKQQVKGTNIGKHKDAKPVKGMKRALELDQK